MTDLTNSNSNTKWVWISVNQYDKY